MVNKQADRSRERAREDYLKAIYHLGAGAPVKAVTVARHLRVSRASVSKLRRVLERDGLLQAANKRVDALTLTPQGQAIAIRMIRRHRLVETFLHRSLGVPLERVHTDAEKIEHSISEDVARRLAEFLGNPVTDPHGHLIPDSAAHKKSSRDAPLLSQNAGERVTVTAIDDRDDKVTRKLVHLGILPGRQVCIVQNQPKLLRLKVGARTVAVPHAAAASVRCTPAVDGRRA